MKYISYLILFFAMNNVSAMESIDYKSLKNVAPNVYSVLKAKESNLGRRMSKEEFKDYSSTEEFKRALDKKISDMCSLPNNENVLVCIERYGRITTHRFKA